MMNIPPSEIERMSLWDYEALLWHWNEAHTGGSEVDPPDPDRVLPMLDRVNSNPLLTN